MANEQNPTPSNDRQKLLSILVPAGALVLIVVLVAVIVGMTDSSGPRSTTKSASGKTMSDGSNGGTEDPDLKELPSGLKYRELKVGSGEVVPAGANVVANYTGWLTNGTEFDSSKKQGRPVPFSLNGVVPGWQEGIPGMRVGGIRKLVIPPELAYGSTPRPGIPPNSTLIFEVEIVRLG